MHGTIQICIHVLTALLSLTLVVVLPAVEGRSVWTCYPNGTQSVVQCISPVQQQYPLTVDEMIRGNDSSVPAMCELYQSMHRCIRYVKTSCRYVNYDAHADVVASMDETVGAFCTYYYEDLAHDEQDQQQTSPTKDKGSKSSAASIAQNLHVIILTIASLIQNTVGS